MRYALIVCVPLALAACGPSISQVTMAYLPPRAADCEIAFAPSIPIEQQRPGGPYIVLGHITIAETGITNPFSPRYAQIVRPRACAMGGELVTIGAHATSQQMIGSGSGTVYTVLKKRPETGLERREGGQI
ncbi:MAG: hypothetical protein H6707_03005 [Deltaproteobacteria bacterium]|nr:hypothetical protein [Deltaproteobacteria bacterium]